MPEIKEYTINVAQEKIDRLKRRLDDIDWPTELEGGDWKYGTPKKDMKVFVDYWRNKFDWREQEKKLNQLPNYEVEVEIDGFGPLKMHFMHQKSDVPNAIPLLFAHGWPGSFLEATKMAPMLTKPEPGKPAFHVVAPSLPNYGFSEGMYKPNFNTKQYCEAMHKVMLACGYNEYVAQGGDWGWLIVRGVSLLFPESVKAVHTNWAYAEKPEFGPNNPEPEYNEREKKHMAQGDRWFPFGMGEGRGYIAIHSTRPHTVNYLLRDSPVGLLSWIWDKLVDWSDDYPWTPEDKFSFQLLVCLWVSIYVFSRAGPDAASHIYYSALHDQETTLAMLQKYIDVPLGIADFPVEICNNPVAWRHTMGPIVYHEIFERGGHFAGWEKPAEVAKGLQEMLGRDGKAYGVVKGKDGY